MKRYNAAVYPYSASFAPYVSSWAKNLLPNVSYHTLISPRGYGLAGQDAGIADGRLDTGYTVQADLEEALNAVNSLLIPSGDYADSMYDKILSHACKAARMGKHVLCGSVLEKQDVELLRKDCENYGCDFLYAAEIAKENLAKQNRVQYESRKLYSPRVPVIFVGEMYPHCNAADVTLALASHFNATGYRSSVYLPAGTQILGFHGADELFMGMSEDMTEGIWHINRCFYALETLERPDIIIVTIPGGLMRYNEVIHNDFGIYAYAIAQAINPDCFVCCFPYGGLSKEYCGHISNLFLQRFGFPIDAFHLSNMMLDGTHLTDFYRFEYTYQPLDAVKVFLDGVFDSNDPVYPALTLEGRNALCAKVEAMLYENAAASTL